MPRKLYLFYCTFFLISHTYAPAQKITTSLFGYPLICPIGIAACPLTTSTGIAAAARRGYGVFTYKTIRTSFHPVSSPKMYHVNIRDQITQQNIGEKYFVHNTQPSSYDMLAITNSFGINSLDPAMTITDIAKARAALTEGQLLIVSMYGSGKNEQEQIADFVTAATIAYKGGAHILEANFSCPNLGQKNMIYQQPTLVYTICKAIHAALPLVPLIIKVGIFQDRAHMRSVIRAAYDGGACGMCGINTVQIQAIDSVGNPIFGQKHQFSGLSGSPIRNLAIQFIKDARAIIEQENLDFILFATGGVTQPEHFDIFFAAGADIVQSATGAMWNISLATDYHILYQQ